MTLLTLLVSIKECLVNRCASSDGKEPFLLIGFLYSRSLESLGQLVEVLVFSSKYYLICSPLVGLNGLFDCNYLCEGFLCMTILSVSSPFRVANAPVD